MLTRSPIFKTYSNSFLSTISFTRGSIHLERYSIWFTGVVLTHLNLSFAVSSILLTDDQFRANSETQRSNLHALAGRRVWQGRPQLRYMHFLFVSVQDLAKKTTLLQYARSTVLKMKWFAFLFSFFDFFDFFSLLFFVCFVYSFVLFFCLFFFCLSLLLTSKHITESEMVAIIENV